jgi:transcriptional regulator with XRE-family HTH domain
MFSPDAAKALRLQLGLTQQRMAELAGYTSKDARMNWSKIEAGERGMDAPRWELLLLRTDVHPTHQLVPRQI